MNKIKQVNQKKEITVYHSIKEASKNIKSKFEDWPVQLLIVNAINTGKRAFTCKWYKI